MIARLLAPLLLAVSAPALAAEDEEALACVKTKVWESYKDGWALRTMRSSMMGLDEQRTSLVTLYAGRSYRFQVCGTEGIGDVDIVMYDLDGKVVVRDSTTDRQPVFEVNDKVGNFYVVVHVRSLAKPGLGGVALAVTHK